MRLVFTSVLLALAAFAASLIWYLPMSTALRFSGAAGQGIAWSQALGRAVDGELVGVAWRNWTIGHVSLRADWAALLQARAPLQADWSGPSSDGLAHVALRPGGARLEGLDARVRLPARRLAGLSVEMPASSLRLQEGRFLLSDGGCQSGEAQAQSDAAQKLGQMAGLDWPALTGTLRCEAGAWSLALSGTSAAGAVFSVTAAERAPTQIRIDAIDPATAQALTFIGLQPAGGHVSLDLPYTE